MDIFNVLILWLFAVIILLMIGLFGVLTGLEILFDKKRPKKPRLITGSTLLIIGIMACLALRRLIEFRIL